MTQVHIASLIVHARPESAREVGMRISCLPAAEIHAIEGGKIIVVVECPNERELAARMDEMRDDPDVLMVSLVYHGVEDDSIEDFGIEDVSVDAEGICT